MSKPIVRLGAVAVALVASSSAAQTTISPKAVIDKYCVTCHNERLKRGDLVLSSLDPDHVGADVATWEKVVKKLHAGVMPPLGNPRPDPATYKAFIASLEGALDRNAAASPNPGRPAIH